VPGGRVLVSLRTAGDVLDRAQTTAARAVLERVLAEQVRRPESTPQRQWAGQDAVAVFTALASARLSAVDTLLAGWEYVIEDLIADGGAADSGQAERAQEVLVEAGQHLARIGAFLQHTGGQARPDLVELRDHHARTSEALITLRTRLASVAEAVRGYEGLDPGHWAFDQPGARRSRASRGRDGRQRVGGTAYHVSPDEPVHLVAAVGGAFEQARGSQCLQAGGSGSLGGAGLLGDGRCGDARGGEAAEDLQEPALAG
jgi:hypothetical protein